MARSVQQVCVGMKCTRELCSSITDPSSTPEIKTRWTQHTNNSNLQQRISDITTWKETLEKTLSDTEKEMDQLMVVKSIAEKALEVKGMPLDVVIDCLSLREGRVSIDNVRDEVEAELNQVRQHADRQTDRQTDRLDSNISSTSGAKSDRSYSKSPSPESQ